jgi:hypothetical protein
VVTAQALVTALLVAVAGITVLAVAVPTYGVPSPERPLQVSAGFLAGTVTMILLGTGLGLSVRTARGAQAIGLLAFFPMFLLSGGGPPPDVMSEPMRRIADILPLTHVIGGIREPWLRNRQRSRPPSGSRGVGGTGSGAGCLASSSRLLGLEGVLTVACHDGQGVRMTARVSPSLACSERNRHRGAGLKQTDTQRASTHERNIDEESL